MHAQLLKEGTTERVGRWFTDAAFAGVRAPAALANLPASERSDWQQFWKDAASFPEVAALPNRALHKTGQEHIARKQWDKAIACFSRVLELDSKDADAWRSAQANFALKNWETAATDFGKLTDLEAQNDVAWVSLGAALNNLGRLQEGITANSKAIALNAQQAKAWENRGWAWVRSKQWDKAVADYSEAIRLQSKNAAASSSQPSVTPNLASSTKHAWITNWL